MLVFTTLLAAKDVCEDFAFSGNHQKMKQESK